jgi:hypothetical protein
VIDRNVKEKQALSRATPAGFLGSAEPRPKLGNKDLNLD